MATFQVKVNGLNIVLLVFALLVLAASAYIMSRNTLALYQSSAATKPGVNIVGGSNSRGVKIVGGSNSISLR